MPDCAAFIAGAYLFGRKEWNDLFRFAPSNQLPLARQGLSSPVFPALYQPQPGNILAAADDHLGEFS